MQESSQGNNEAKLSVHSRIRELVEWHTSTKEEYQDRYTKIETRYELKGVEVIEVKEQKAGSSIG